MRPEREVEIKLFNWFISRKAPYEGNVKEVFFNSKNEVSCKTFKVKGECKTIPDLLLKLSNPFNGANECMAIEVKDAKKSKNVRDGSKIFSEYLLNYVEGKTKYFIEGEEIKISHFALATQFSEEGHLKKKEKLEFNESVRGKSNIGGKIVPFYEFSGTKEIYRGMISSFSKYRKDNNLKIKLPSLGIFISEVLLNFDFDELEIQKGMKGLPIYQAITFNEINKRWVQCLMKI